MSRQTKHKSNSNAYNLKINLIIQFGRNCFVSTEIYVFHIRFREIASLDKKT